TITNAATGDYSYTPAPNYNGPASFTFKASDGSLNSNTATVSITVVAVADLTAQDDTYSTNEDTALSGSVAANDSTTSGGTLSYATATQPTHDTTTTNAAGTYTYTPAANYNGPHSFTYTVTDADSGESDTRTVSITVAAVADLTAQDDTFSTNE